MLPDASNCDSMLLRRSSDLAWDSAPPQSVSTAVRRADQDRRAAVTPAWNSAIISAAACGCGAAMVATLTSSRILMAVKNERKLRPGFADVCYFHFCLLRRRQPTTNHNPSKEIEERAS